MNICHVRIFFHGEYFSGVNISQFKFRICTDYFGLVSHSDEQFYSTLGLPVEEIPLLFEEILLTFEEIF